MLMIVAHSRNYIIYYLLICTNKQKHTYTLNVQLGDNPGL